MPLQHLSKTLSSPDPNANLPVAHLLALAAGVFIAQTAEFLPGGLVPLIAVDLSVQAAIVGQMISVFAFTVVLATTPLAFLFRRADRKAIVIFALAVISLGNLGVALSPSFEWIIVLRIAGALSHGLFWAVVVTYAAELVSPEKLGRAMAFTGGGGGVASILGIPIGNALGQEFGWRPAFIAVAATGLLVTLVLWRWLPRIDHGTRSRSTREIKSSWDRSMVGVAMVCVIILVLVLSQTSFGPYATVWLEQIAGMHKPIIPVYLLITGLAGALGAVGAGYLYDRFPRSGFAVASAVLATALCFHPAAAATGFGVPLVAVAILSSLSFSVLPVMLQARMMHTASPQMRRTAGAIQTTIFNVGIGGGAVVGGLIMIGAGVQMLPWFAAGGAALTGLMMLGWDLLARKS